VSPAVAVAAAAAAAEIRMRQSAAVEHQLSDEVTLE